MESNVENHSTPRTRRRWLRDAALGVRTAAIVAPFAAAAPARAQAPNPRPDRMRLRLEATDERFLEDLGKRTFRYFIEQAGKETGLVHDRARTDGSFVTEGVRNVASSAATGFGLTALCIGAERKWIDRDTALRQVLRTLEFYANRSHHEHGWFYHFVDQNSAKRVWNSEISSIDTALLLAGILTAKQYFRDADTVAKLADSIYHRVDFPWMLNGDPHILCHGYRPETGMLKARWGRYSEHAILYLLAIGSPTLPIPAESWYAWERPGYEYAGYEYIGLAPLFTHQFSHAWVDFRGREESRGTRVDWFENSERATLAHRQFCIDLNEKFPGCYNEDLWGITASDTRVGYRAWGGPPARGPIDGSSVPCAAAGSLMFAPKLCADTLRNMHDNFGERIYGHYGFADAFHPLDGWTNPDVIGIDLGITLLSAENARTQKCGTGSCGIRKSSAPSRTAAWRRNGPHRPRRRSGTRDRAMLLFRREQWRRDVRVPATLQPSARRRAAPYSLRPRRSRSCSALSRSTTPASRPPGPPGSKSGSRLGFAGPSSL